MDVITPELLMEQGRQLHELAISIATREDLLLNDEYRKERLMWQDEVQKERLMWQGEVQKERLMREQENIDMINELLTIHFDVKPMRYEERLAKLDVASLKQLRRQSITLASLADFDQALRQLEA